MLIESNLFQSLFDVIPFGVYVSDVDTCQVVYMNIFMRERVGTEFGIGSPCWKAIYRQEEQCSFCRVRDLLNDEGRPNGRTEIFEHFDDTNDRWYQLQEKAMSWPDGRVVKYSIAVDISELKGIQNHLAEAHAELSLKTRDLERLSITDPLTGLYNRLKIHQALEQELARVKRYGDDFSIILIDLDYFKLVNDTHGHLVGDQVLCAVADTLRRNLREVDLAGRWGGEEFIVLCGRTNEAEALKVGEKLRAAIAEIRLPITVEVTASVGVAACRSGESCESLLNHVDQRLYQAKDQGRNRVVGREQ